MQYFDRFKLRHTLTVAFMAFFAMSFVIIYFGLDNIETYLQRRVISQLPAPAQAAIAAMDKKQLPTSAQIQSLIDSAQFADERINQQHYILLAVLSIAAVLLGVALARWVAGAIAGPLEKASAASRKIAVGDLSARVDATAYYSRELRDLVSDFNTMGAQLQTYNRELRETGAATAHELRTPLTILRVRLQGILDGVFAPEASEISALIGQVDALSRIVDDIRTVSLAASAQLRLNLQPIDLAKEVRSVLTAQGPDLVAAGIVVELDLQPAPALADPDRVRQMVIGLLTNVERHAKRGGAATVETVHQDGFAVLRVSDRGPGLPPSDPNVVFRRFWRGDDSRSRDTGGSGLGLSVVRAITLAHQGQAEAMNRAGGGAVIEIKLPDGST